MIQTFSSTIRRKEMDAVLTCMVDEKTGPGELNSRFVQGIKEFFGCDGAVAFRSPSIALSYILKALDLEKNTGIMVSALAPYWQLCAIENLGYKPVILDVREETGLIDCQIVQQGIACGGRLLILHESMGILPEIEKICALGIPVIEDVSQSVGATVEKIGDDENVSEVNSKNKKNKAGTFGIFSIMGLEEFDTVTGGGGAVVGVIAVQYDAYLLIITKVAYEARALIAPVTHCVLRRRHVMSAATHYVTEPPFHHSFLDAQVNDGFFFAVIYACEHSLIGLLVHYFDLFNNL